MEYIFTVTAVRVQHNGMLEDRCYGWYPTFVEAEEAVFSNEGDLFEDLYEHAVIEKVPPGICARMFSEDDRKPEEWWYRVRSRTRDDIVMVEPCSKPAGLEGDVCFSMG